MSPSASALRSTISSPRSARRRTRCKAFQRRSGKSTHNCRLSPPRRPRRSTLAALQPYRDALAATQSLQQSFAADSSPRRRGLASRRRRDLRRRGKGGATRDLGRIEDSSRTLRSRSSPSMPRRRASTRSLSSKSSRFRSRRSVRNTPPNSPRCKSRRLSASNRLPQSSASTTCSSKRRAVATIRWRP